jgi:hypothetical protein
MQQLSSLGGYQTFFLRHARATAGPAAASGDQGPLLQPATPTQSNAVDGPRGDASQVVSLLDRKMSITYDAHINRFIVKVIRDSTGEVVRQLPAAELVALMTKLRQNVRGLFVQHTV